MRPEACSAANTTRNNRDTPAFLQFRHPADLAAWCHNEIQAWYAQASGLENSKPVSCDQEYQETLIHFKPPHPELPPLLLLGGMGPLAGLRGLQCTIQHLRYKREIIFYQACSLPCRSQAIQAQQSGDHSLYASMIRQLSAAIDYARSYLHRPREMSLLLLCNTVHYFLPTVQQQLDQESLNVVSLIDAGIEAIRNHGGDKPLLLASPGTYLSGLYTEYSIPNNKASSLRQSMTQQVDAHREKRLAKEQYNEKRFAENIVVEKTFSEKKSRINFIVPNDAGKACLNHAIFDGIKGGNTHAALKWGEALFENLPYSSSTSILAACTEVPEFIDLLRNYGSPQLRQRLNQLIVINPVNVAIGKLSL